MAPACGEIHTPVPSPSYQRAQERLGSALHIYALTLVIRLPPPCTLSAGTVSRPHVLSAPPTAGPAASGAGQPHNIALGLTCSRHLPSGQLA